MPVPDATTDVTVGAAVSIKSVPVGLAIEPEVTSALPCASNSVAPPVLKPITCKSAVFSPAATVYVNNKAVEALPLA